MRYLMMFNRVSADGYFAGPDGSLDWAVPDDELDQAGVAALPHGDTILFGRKTYDDLERFWPHALKDPKTAPDPHMPRRVSPALREMAAWINDATKVVFSRTRKEVTWQNSRLVHEFDPREIETMKQGPGKAIMIFGSGTIVTELARHGLIDEFQFIVTPILLGSGKQLLGGLTKLTKLTLLEAKPYRSGNVMLRYAPA